MKPKFPSLNLLKRTKKSVKGFVQASKSDLESFKSRLIHSSTKKIPSISLDHKRIFNSIMEKPRLWASKIDWGTTTKLFALWIGEVLIEGAMANWSTHKLLGLEFGLGMIIAHGFLIKQTLDLYWRLKKHGGPERLIAKN